MPDDNPHWQPFREQYSKDAFLMYPDLRPPRAISASRSLEHMFHVHFDRTFGDIQTSGNHLFGNPSRDELQNIAPRG